MRLLSIELHHFCQHRDLVHDWHPGLNALVGANASGKTAIVGAVQVALTNDCTIFAGDKADNVSQYAPPGAPSRIVLRLEHGDRAIAIQRGIRGCRSVMQVDGEEPVVGDVKITARLGQILGVGMDTLSTLAFVQQRRMADFLLATAARRAEMLADLFGTARAERLHGVLSKELAACPLVQAGGEAGVLERQLAEAEARLAGIRAELAALGPAGAADPEADWARGVLEARRAHEAAAQAAAARRRQLDGWLAEAGPLREQEAALAAEKAIFAAAVQEIYPAAEVAARDLERWRDHHTWLRLAAARDGQRAALDREEAGLAVPAEPTDAERAAAEAFAVEGVGLRTWLESHRLLVAAARAGRPCPTCGAATDNLSGRLAAAEAERPDIEARYGELARADGVVGDCGRKRQAYEQRLRSIEQRRAQLVATGPVDAVAAPGISEAECRATIAEAEDFRRRAADADRRHAAAAARLEQLEQLIGQAGDEQAAVAAPPPADVERAAAILAARAAGEQRRAVLTGQAAELGAAVDRDRGRLAALRAELEAAARSNAWRAHVDGLRAAVHRDALPRLVAQSRMDEIREDVDELLERFESTFRVEVGEDLSFTARFLDGRRQPAIRLSGGEKVLLALAFRIAVNAAFANELGILVFDEPTDSLDVQNMKCLEIAIARLREVAASRSLQVILVTHERKLARLCDATLDLGGWKE